MLALGADHVGAALPPVLSYWRELGVRYVTALCALSGLGDGGAKSAVPLPGDDALQRMAAGVPPMAGPGRNGRPNASRSVPSCLSRCRPAPDSG